jgi:Rieske Fe-S protein
VSTSIDRRRLLVLGATTLGSGCVWLRMGAVHEKIPITAMQLEDGWLRIPQEALVRLGGDAVLQVQPGDPYPDILVAQRGETLLAVTADCTHWGCTVDWAPAPGEWQCGCHGSRFNAEGELLEGPADEPLRRVAHERVAGTLRLHVAPLAES